MQKGSRKMWLTPKQLFSYFSEKSVDYLFGSKHVLASQIKYPNKNDIDYWLNVNGTSFLKLEALRQILMLFMWNA